jgi:hypothetical protein
MATTAIRQNSLLYPIQPKAPLTRHLAWVTVVTILSAALVPLAFAQVTAEFHRTLTVTPTETLVLDVEIPSGELQVLYGRDGQASISGVAKASADAKLDDNFFPAVLTIAQEGNHLTVRHVPSPVHSEEGIRVLYRIDVPYRTEVTSRLNQGKQNISGILGPVKALAGNGDIKASYVSKGLQARVDNGNLDLQVIGDHVEAETGRGNISCSRVAQGVSAETGAGDITLVVVGPSTATVKKGSGRIDVGGARGSLIGSTDEGDIHVRAIPHDDWQLHSVSGNIRIELPPAAKFELDATTDSGNVLVDRDDIAKPDAAVPYLHRQVNGGGKRIDAHTNAGTIVIR